MHLTITSPDTVLFEGHADSVTCPGADGELTVLPHHIALVTTLKKGNVTVHNASTEAQIFPIERGILEVAENRVVVLV